jgi:hypothetical protein
LRDNEGMSETPSQDARTFNRLRRYLLGDRPAGESPDLEEAVFWARGVDVSRFGNRVQVELLYPGTPGHLTEIELGMEHARAADSLLINYDFERDGWSIKQASRWDDPEDQDWQEVAFAPAWGRDPRPAR